VKIFNSRGVLKVSKGAHTSLKASRRVSLYVLQVSTMTGSLIASTFAPIDIFTHVCHMWSNNITKQDLCMLSSIAKLKHPSNLSGPLFA